MNQNNSSEVNVVEVVSCAVVRMEYLAAVRTGSPNLSKLADSATRTYKALSAEGRRQVRAYIALVQSGA